MFGPADLGPATPDISANFNVNLGQPGYQTGIFFYLGLDNNHGNDVDLVTVLIHEFGHGLGFQSFGTASFGPALSSPGVTAEIMPVVERRRTLGLACTARYRRRTPPPSMAFCTVLGQLCH